MRRIWKQIEPIEDDGYVIPKEENGHSCAGTTANAECGPAITYCYEEGGKYEGCFWVGNGEYESQVNFCPFCGEKAGKPACKKVGE